MSPQEYWNNSWVMVLSATWLQTFVQQAKINIKICGGEIITTPKEMVNRIKDQVYDFVQPDASVIGGISAVMDIFAAGKANNTDVVVHAWGGAVAIMASYHAAFAADGQLVEYPMLDFPLGRKMMTDQGKIEQGRLIKPTAPGLGITLTLDMEARCPFDESAVYSCMLHDCPPHPIVIGRWFRCNLIVLNFKKAQHGLSSQSKFFNKLLKSALTSHFAIGKRDIIDAECIGVFGMTNLWRQATSRIRRPVPQIVLRISLHWIKQSLNSPT